MSNIEERLDALEARVTETETAVAHVETIVDATDEGRYTQVVEDLMEKYGWTAEEATTNFNNVLNSVAAGKEGDSITIDGETHAADDA